MEATQNETLDMIDTYMLEKELSYREQSAEEVRQDRIQNIIGIVATSSYVETYLVSRP